jgi:selenocysteine lyase/cysteine desulfurase
LSRVRRKEEELTAFLMEEIKKIGRVEIYGPDDPCKRAPLLSFNIEGWDPVELTYLLDKYYDIYLRAGLHCAPGAHRIAGTFPRGSVRASFGPFNTHEDVENLIRALREIIGMG